MALGVAPTAASRCAPRCVSTPVFPDPAPAITGSGPSVVKTASRWAGFRSARYVSGWVADTRSRYRSGQPVQLLLEPRSGRSERVRIGRLEHHLDGRAVDGEPGIRADEDRRPAVGGLDEGRCDRRL